MRWYRTLMILAIIGFILSGILAYRYWNESEKKENIEKLNIANDLLIDGLTAKVSYSDEYTEFSRSDNQLGVSTEYTYNVNGKEYKNEIYKSDLNSLVNVISKDTMVTYNPAKPEIHSFNPANDYDEYYANIYDKEEEGFPSIIIFLSIGSLVVFLYGFIGLKYDFW